MSDQTPKPENLVLKTATPTNEVAYQALIELLRKYSADTSLIDMLAIASNLVGKLIALQDQRVTTEEMAMRVVAKNIEEGNRQVLEEMSQSRGRA